MSERYQLRVHFASLGHPIVGDDLYGEPHPLMPRQALHAYELTFPHPVTDQAMTLRAPLPEDLQELLKAAFPSSFPESENDL